MDALSDDILRRLVTGYGDFVAEHGEAIGSPDLVLPNAEFFPDELTSDADGVDTVLRRILSYAPVSADLDVRMRFVESEDGSGSCGPCGCGVGAGPRGKGVAVVDAGDGYVIDFDVADARHPVVLTTSLARSVGAIVVHEAGEEVVPLALASRAEVAAVASGFGVLLANGAHIYGKSCGGASVVQATRHSVEEMAHLLAMFVRQHEMKPGKARSELDPTQREAFDSALSWLDANADIVEALRDHPASLGKGYFKLQPRGGALGRLFA